MINHVTQARRVELKLINDGPDGSLVVGENNKEIPFKTQRVYLITRLNNPLAVRGKHAHKTLEEVVVCLNGSFELLLDDGYHRTSVRMKDPSRAVYMGPRLWRVMRRFSKNCVLAVFASDFYKEADYIRDYQQFIDYIKAYAGFQPL